MIGLALFMFGIIIFALMIDWKRKKNKNVFYQSKITKNGDDTNYVMGDNKFTHGG